MTKLSYFLQESHTEHYNYNKNWIARNIFDFLISNIFIVDIEIEPAFEIEIAEF